MCRMEGCCPCSHIRASTVSWAMRVRSHHSSCRGSALAGADGKGGVDGVPANPAAAERVLFRFFFFLRTQLLPPSSGSRWGWCRDPSTCTSLSNSCWPCILSQSNILTTTSSWPIGRAGVLDALSQSPHGPGEQLSPAGHSHTAVAADRQACRRPGGQKSGPQQVQVYTGMMSSVLRG